MRSLLSALALAVALPAHAQAPAGQPSVRLLVQSSPLAGFRYGEAARLWPLLNVGDPLGLVREPANAHDANAVRIEWRGHRLGYVPRAENRVLAWALDGGADLRAHISRLREHPNPRRRIEFEVFVE